MEQSDLEKRIEKIEARNKKVEANKAWETSLTRKITIAVITYFVIVLCLTIIHNADPWINACIPAAGFLLSTLTVTYVKDLWLKYFYKGK